MGGGLRGSPSSTHKNMLDRLDKLCSALAEARLKTLPFRNSRYYFLEFREFSSNYRLERIYRVMIWLINLSQNKYIEQSPNYIDFNLLWVNTFTN